MVRDSDSVLEAMVSRLQNPQRRRRDLSTEWRAYVPQDGKARAVSYVMWNDKGRFNKWHAAEPGHQHTLCSLWLDYTPMNGLRFPHFSKAPDVCKRCIGVAQKQLGGQS